MKVHEIMTGHAHHVAPDNNLVEAAGLMRKLEVGSLPVWADDALMGIVTDRDIVVRGVADGQDPNGTRVSEVMSGPSEFVFADQEVEEAARLMEKRKIRRLPVLNRGRKLVGMISLGDIATSSNPAFSGEALRDVSEPARPTSRRRRLEQSSKSTRVRGATRDQRRAGGRRRASATADQKAASRKKRRRIVSRTGGRSQTRGRR